MDQQSQPLQAQPVQTPQQPVPPALATTAKKSPSKVLLLILGFIIILIAIGAAYVLVARNNAQKPAQVAITPTIAQPTPTPDPMADWKTYNDPDKVFTIKYPPNWPYVQTTNDIKFYPPEADLVNDKNTLSYLEIILANTPFSQSPTGNVQKEGVDFIIDWNLVTVDGVEGHAYRYMNCAPKCTTNIDLPYDNGKKTLKMIYFSDENKQTFDQIISTLKFTDASEADTTSSTTTVRKIAYKKTPGLTDYVSATGYSLQIPTGFQAGESEKMNGNQCAKYFNNGAGGITSAIIVPYDGGSRRALLPEEESYTYTYEDVMLQGIKSLIQQIGPVGESGTGSFVIIPVGRYALIVGIGNRAKDDPQFTSLLQSIKFNPTLDITKCGK
ncbi:MAG: hypothetical protein HYV40_05940 [Candidatus Levybacteria bacterium]|nr:hypothetical protein [Candidatus Levybacteria bacterium]